MDQFIRLLLSKISADAGTIKEKSIIILLCMIGIPAVIYGMLKDNTPIFIIGLSFVIGGYLLIRRRLKESIQRKS